MALLDIPRNTQNYAPNYSNMYSLSMNHENGTGYENGNDLWVAFKKAVCMTEVKIAPDLLGASVLRDGFGALTDCVLGKFTRQQQTYSGLDLPAGDGRALVVLSQA